MTHQVPSAAAAPTTPGGLRLRVLGCSGGYPGPASACSGYLLEAAGRRIWIDAGGGTLAQLQRHCTLADLDAVWVSHLHPDHCSDLPLAFQVLAFSGLERSQPLPVLGPAGWAQHMEAFLARPGAMARVFEVIELTDGAEVAFGDLQLEAIATVHGIETYGLRATLAGRTLAYTADSGPCPALERLADRSDLLVCEAFLSPGGPFQVSAETNAISLTPQQAGQFAAAGRTRRLVLTHLPPDADATQARELAAASFGGEVEIAVQEGRFELLPALD
jgi:ribonuclease BN (tRNA processing enzyme)